MDRRRLAWSEVAVLMSRPETQTESFLDREEVVNVKRDLTPSGYAINGDAGSPGSAPANLTFAGMPAVGKMGSFEKMGPAEINDAAGTCREIG